MRLLSFTCDILGVLEKVEIDFAGLGPGLIGIGGATGAGKSTFLGLTGPGVIYQTLPYYDCPVWDHMPEGGMAQSIYDFDGRRITFKIEASKSGRQKRAYVHAEGEAPVGPLLMQAQAAALKYVPPPDLLYATVFAAQGGGGSFFKIKEALRRQLFIQLLDLMKYEERASVFASLQRQARDEVSYHEERIQTLTAKMDRAEFLRHECDMLEEMLRDLLVPQGEPIQAAVTAATERIAVLREAVAADQAKRNSLRGQAATLTNALRDLKDKIAAATSQTTAQVPERDPQQYALDLANVKNDLANLEALIEPLSKQVDEISGLVIASNGEVTKLADQVQAETGAIETKHKAWKKRSADLTALSDALKGVDLSIKMCQVCPLTAKGQEAQATFEAEHAAYREVLRDANQLVAQITEQQLIAAGTLEEARQQLTLMSPRHSAIQKEIEDKKALLAATQTAWQTALEIAQRAQNALKAAGELEQLLQQEATALSTMNAITNQLREPPVAEAAALVAAQSELRTAEEQLQAWQDRVGTARERLSALKGQLQELVEAEAELKAVQAKATERAGRAEDCGDIKVAWTAVRWALIAYACPKVEQLSNEFLQNFQGGRFRVALPTAVDKADNKGQKDAFVPIVIDTWADSAEREQVSGGETGICDEALRAAIEIYRTERSGHAVETAWRDEPTSALDESAATHYVTMLRQMWSRCRMYQLLYVTHSVDARAAADRLLWIEDRQVMVR